MIPTVRRDRLPAPLPGGGDWAVVLEHERVPFVSYPYEWSFGMLRDAAHADMVVLMDGRRVIYFLQPSRPRDG